MKSFAPVVLALGLLAQGVSTTAPAAVPGLSGVIIAASPQLLNLRFPLAGTLGNVSLATLDLVPGLSTLNLPVIHTFSGVPVLGGITLAQGANLLGSVALLQHSLPGLASFGK